jgi:rod shape determining protein RodA
MISALGTYRPRLAVLLIVAAMLALMLVGLAAVDISAQADGVTGYTTRQAIFAVAAILTCVLFAAVPYTRWGKIAYLLFGVTLAMLLLLAIVRFLHIPFGLIPEKRGAYRWIDLGVIQLQPSELAKLTFILMLAWYLRLGDHYRRLAGLIPPFVLTFLPMGLVLYQPDLGTALLFLPTLYFMLFMAGARLTHLLGVVGLATALLLIPIPCSTAEMGAEELANRRHLAYWAGAGDKPSTIVTPAAVAGMKMHQIRRITGWLRQGDEEVIQASGYHLHRSKIVLGSGKLTGRGQWQEGEIYFRLLPDDHTDFIFSIIGGQWGLLGCLGVLALYGLIFIGGVEIAAYTHDAFGRLLVVGVLGLLASQIFINVGMTMGLMPVTGMTLPLISYGGSSLVANAAAVGLLINVGQRQRILLSRRPFEHQDGRVASAPLDGAQRIGQRSDRPSPARPTKGKARP